MLWSVVHHNFVAYAELLLRPVRLSASRSRSKDKTISRPTLLNLVRLDVPKLVHLGCLASDHTLGELNGATDSRAPADGVLCGLAGDLDEANARVLRATVVLAVTEVAEPCLESGRVELLNTGAVGFDGGSAGDAGPLAGVVEEGEVDLGVLFEVVGLARLGVGVENEVDAIVLLRCCVSVCSDLFGGYQATHPCGEGHASAGKKTVLSLGGHHAELALINESLEVLDLLLEGGVLDVLRGVRVGGLVAGVGVGEGRHSEGLFVDSCKSWDERSGDAGIEDTSQRHAFNVVVAWRC